MQQRHRIAVQHFIGIVCWLIFNAAPGLAKPLIELVSDPAPQDMQIQIATVREIWIEARANEPLTDARWKVDGTGEFQQLEGGMGGIYRVPTTIATAAQQVVVTMTAKTANGQAATASITLNLVAPEPTPTPSPIPTAEPTPTPVPQPIQVQYPFIRQEKFFVQAGQTAIIGVQLVNPSGLPFQVQCSALKGKAESVPSENASATVPEIRYAAPTEAGKDLLEIQIMDAQNGANLRQMVKIEVLE